MAPSVVPSSQSPGEGFHPQQGSGILDRLLEGCQIIGPDWRYLYVNAAAAEQGRRPREDLVGLTMPEAYPGIERTPMFETLTRCMRERTYERMENEFIYPDGSRGWFELRFEPVPEGVFILSMDVTERKLAEARVTHLNAVLKGLRAVGQLILHDDDPENLIHNACEVLVHTRGFQAAAIVLTDPEDGSVQASARSGVTNQGLIDLIGSGRIPECAREALAKSRFVLRRGHDERCLNCPAFPDHPDEAEELTIPLEFEGTAYGFMIVTLPAMMGEDPEECALLAEMAMDLAHALRGFVLRSERDRSAAALIRAEEQLRKSQRLKAIGRLAGGVAHDFNNILAVQIGLCDLIDQEIEPDHPIADDVAAIRASAERAADLTRQLLAFGRRQALRVETVQLNDVVAGLHKMLLRLIGEDIVLGAELAGDLGNIEADRSQVEQIIMNLVINARDAMPDGGTVTLETANVQFDRGYLGRHLEVSSGPHVMLAVTDTGCGMDRETQEHLFEPFFTTKDRGKGTGLGLATVYGIVKQSRGHIWVYSEPGRGSTFKVYFPQVFRESDAVPERRPTKPVQGKGQLVLLVEDDPTLRNLIGKTLTRGGYIVHAAGTGEEALAAVKTEGLAPAVLLTDVVMPGMNGRTLSDHLGGVIPGLKTLFMSGYTDNAIIHHGVLDAGIFFLQKPFTSDSLLASIQELLRET
ncbi:MAG: ATP-binding protein [Candidatus Krumholzibacteriia bacterium]